MFRQSKLSIYFEFGGKWPRVAAGGWLEGPEKTIDLGKSQGEAQRSKRGKGSDQGGMEEGKKVMY